MNDEKIGNNAFVTADVHGCYDSFIDLLQLAKVNIDKDRIVIIGDVIDKGPKSLEMMQCVEKYGIVCVQGNHENKVYRLAKGNDVKITSELADTVKQLGQDFVRYGLIMGQWPCYISFEDDQGHGQLVHAGVSPHKSIENQDPKFLRMLRTWPFEMYEKDLPAKNPPWQMAYTGHLGTIIHGHIPSSTVKHSGEILHDNPHVYSLDGGCVYGASRPWGGVLRGMRLGTRELFFVSGTDEQTAHYDTL